MKNSFNLTIALPGQNLYTVECKRLRIPGINGSIGIMAGRQPLLAGMEPGLIHVIDIKDQEIWLATTGGFCEMHGDQATLLCDSLLSQNDFEENFKISDKPLYKIPSKLVSENKKRDFIKQLLGKKISQISQL